MFKLDTFYRSREWRNLINVIKMERTNEDGLIICEHCGKPIVNKYDCIGHHTTFLTEDNVNDADISLNPNNIALVHHACHNKIHNKLGYKRREIYLVYGSPLSGKTSYVESVIEVGDLVIDIDNIWQCVSGCDRYIKPPRLNSVVFGVRDYLMDCVKVRRGKWQNCYIIGGYPLISERERLCKTLGAREIYIDSTKEECLERLKLSDNRDYSKWSEYIEGWWKKYTPLSQ